MEKDTMSVSEKKQILSRIKQDIDSLATELLRPQPAGPLSPIHDLGLRIRRARMRDELTQEALSELASVSKVSVGKIERGEQSANLSTLLKICNVLGIKVWLE